MIPVFVPAVFLLIEGLSRRLGRLLGRFVGERDEPEAPLPDRISGHVA